MSCTVQNKCCRANAKCSCFLHSVRKGLWNVTRFQRRATHSVWWMVFKRTRMPNELCIYGALTSGRITAGAMSQRSSTAVSFRCRPERWSSLGNQYSLKASRMCCRVNRSNCPHSNTKSSVTYTSGKAILLLRSSAEIIPGPVTKKRHYIGNFIATTSGSEKKEERNTIIPTLPFTIQLKKITY